MDFSPLNIIKPGDYKDDFPVSTPNKGKIPSWTFAASFQVFLTTCPTGRWKKMSAENGFERASS